MHIEYFNAALSHPFLAGDALRSKSRYKGLDETGVIGVVCRHEFPYRVLSMRHGERSVTLSCYDDYIGQVFLHCFCS